MYTGKQPFEASAREIDELNQAHDGWLSRPSPLRALIDPHQDRRSVGWMWLLRIPASHLFPPSGFLKNSSTEHEGGNRYGLTLRSLHEAVEGGDEPGGGRAWLGATQSPSGSRSSYAMIKGLRLRPLLLVHCWRSRSLPSSPALDWRRRPKERRVMRVSATFPSYRFSVSRSLHPPTRRPPGPLYRGSRSPWSRVSSFPGQYPPSPPPRLGASTVATTNHVEGASRMSAAASESC